ncbi:MAG: DctP family TRAP transporter solute-binding subunit [Sedimentibacter sp.]|uniref:DctP family TRAP transporter solute-binding subunit n=1 Tax=Sedimentibacter sp. TaxID=1960295 RepID=UPI0029812607|nr:DctP family TRAP transporter solute-binding subunit [Sedimentibacter sp.]MDW5299122.1 DctP family TRAP transporter solute-binding subunit [Sedimentibacter sp.]
MKKFNKVTAIILAMVMIVSLAACSSNTDTKPADENTDNQGASEPVVLKLGTTVNEEDSFQVAAEKFAELVNERTNGAYTIEIFPNGSLGDERTMLESMQMNTLDMGIITSGPFSNFVPEMGVLDMPFLFGNNEEAYKVLDGEVGQELLGKLENANLKGLAYAERGFRNLTNSKKTVEKASDAAGLKIRVMENEVYTKTFNSLGVNAVPMAWTEALTALQQGTIDGQENPINVIYSYKLWESQKNVTMTRHAYAAALITMSLDKFNKLPEDVQTIFKESAQEAAEYERQWVADNEESQIAALIENGMEIVTEPDLNSFKEAVQSVYAEYPQYSDYLNRISDALK